MEVLVERNLNAQRVNFNKTLNIQIRIRSEIRCNVFLSHLLKFGAHKKSMHKASSIEKWLWLWRWQLKLRQMHEYEKKTFSLTKFGHFNNLVTQNPRQLNARRKKIVAKVFHFMQKYLQTQFNKSVVVFSLRRRRKIQLF